MREEIELFGVAFEQRGAWSDEALRIMKACWREERPSFRGAFVSFDPLGFAPKPARGTIPIWIGGPTPPALPPRGPPRGRRRPPVPGAQEKKRRPPRRGGAGRHAGAR